MKIKFTPTFKRDFKRNKKKQFDMEKLQDIIQLIVDGKEEILRLKYDDHVLKGK